MPAREISGEEVLAGQSRISFASPAFIREFRKVAEAKARDFAVSAHEDQLYGDRPYIEHLEAVASVLRDFDFHGDCLTAGWLHDVIEDTDTSVVDLEAAFNERVAKLVWAVTGGGERAAHTASIYEKIASFPEAASVKLADRIANLEACKARDKHSIRYNREQVDFANIIQMHVPPAMWQRYLEALTASQDAVRATTPTL